MAKGLLLDLEDAIVTCETPCDLVATSCDLSAISLRSCRDLKRLRCDPMRCRSDLAAISATSTRHVRSRGTRWSRAPGELTEDKSSFGDDPMPARNMAGGGTVSR